ncbi:MAG: DUF59 domain-containing protein [Actinomycetota bacterium]|nr:MAG: DUF59 domain-containing protein [Actinomycetota bacterium]
MLPPEGSAGTDSEDQELIGIVWQTLSQVYDPELGIDLVSLGLIYEVSKDGNTVNIKMTLTTPGCPASENLPDMAQLAVSFALEGRAEVNLDVVWDPPWDVSMMNPSTAMGLGF